MSKKTNQNGPRKSRTRTAVIVVIILAVIGVIGYFVWTNYLHKNTNKAEPVVTKSKTFTYNKLSLSFNYPSNWTIADDAKLSGGTVTSPDGNVQLKYEAVTIDSSGGSCSIDSPTDKYTITSLSWESVPSISGVIFRQASSKYVSSSFSVYNYKFGLTDDTDNSFKAAKTGDNACSIDKITSGLIQSLNDASDPKHYLSFSGIFKDLDAAGAKLTQSQIDNDFASSDAKTARDILKSTTVKQEK